MAGLEGFEPPTPGFGDRCSSQTELQACVFLGLARLLRQPARSSLRSIFADTSRSSRFASLHPNDPRKTPFQSVLPRRASLLPRLLVRRVLAAERAELP